MAYFPMFIDLTNQSCLVVGGGEVALRKVRVLLDFEASVIVVSKEVCPALKALAESSTSVTVVCREFRKQDVEDRKLVIAATDDGLVNHQISELCHQKKIPVNVVDKREECSFILPSYVKEKNLVAAFSSGGNSPVLTQYLKAREKEIMFPELGEINEQLGNWRKTVQQTFTEEKDRKRVFSSVLEYALEQQRVPTDHEIEKIIKALESEV